MATAHAVTRKPSTRPSSKKEAFATPILPDNRIFGQVMKSVLELHEETHAKYQQLEAAYVRRLEQIRLVLALTENASHTASRAGVEAADHAQRSCRSRETGSPDLSVNQASEVSRIDDASMNFSSVAENFACFFQEKYDRVLDAMKLARGGEKKELQEQAERYSALTHLWTLFYQGSWNVACQFYSEECKVEGDLPPDAVEFLSDEPETSDEEKTPKELLPPPLFDTLTVLAKEGFGECERQ